MTNAATSAKYLSDYICYFQRGLICRKSNLFCFLSQMTVGGNLFEIYHDGILLKFPEPRWRHMLEWGVNIIYLSFYISLLSSFSGGFIFIPDSLLRRSRILLQLRLTFTLHKYFWHSAGRDCISM